MPQTPKRSGRRTAFRVDRYFDSLSHLPTDLLTQLQLAQAMLSRREYRPAYELLQRLDKIYPDSAELQYLRMELGTTLNDIHLIVQSGERLSQLRPADVDVHWNLALSHLRMEHPALTIQELRLLLEYAPNDPRAAEAKRMIAELQDSAGDTWGPSGPYGQDGFAAVMDHERLQVLMATQDFERAKEIGARLIARAPTFSPAWNNLSLMYRMEGNYTEAIRHAEHVLSFDPVNVQALGNLTQLLCITGRLDEARQVAERLKAMPTINEDIGTKQAESLSYLADDEVVLKIFNTVEASGSLLPQRDSLLMHLAAVSFMRTGNEKKARDLWRRAIAAAPNHELIQANLDDLRLPQTERNAPFAFLVNYWIRDEVRKEMEVALRAAIYPSGKDAKAAHKTVKSRGDASDESDGVKQVVQALCDRHPQLIPLVPVLLDRGDPAGRHFALIIAEGLHTPEMLALLRNFALGQRGDDKMRIDVAMWVGRYGGWESTKIKLWLEGEWREVMMTGVEITGEPTRVPPDPASPLGKVVYPGYEALQARDGKRVERLFRQAVELEPDNPSWHNNLSNGLEMQGREEEALAMVREIHAKWPDYVFAITRLAIHHSERGEFDEAYTLLDSLNSRKQMYVTEHRSVVTTQIRVLLAQGNIESAESWLAQLTKTMPDDPAIPDMQQRIREARAGQRRAGRMGRK